jgi:hypothetical protein
VVWRQVEGMQTIAPPGPALTGRSPRLKQTGAGRWATVGRLALGGYFLLMAGVNIGVTLPNAHVTYSGLGKLSWPHFVWIPELISGPVAVPFTVLLIVWEVVVGVLLLGRAKQYGSGSGQHCSRCWPWHPSWAGTKWPIWLPQS